MKCENCKTENHEKRNFCKKCGNPLNEVAKQLFPEMIVPKNNK
jgi:rRNA maturation endonuclease Nob1